MWRCSVARVGRARADRLEALLDVALGGRVVDVHVLGAERAAVRVLQRLDDVAQAHPRRAAAERADVELRVQVGVGEPVGREVEVRRCGAAPAASAGRGRPGTCRACGTCRSSAAQAPACAASTRRPSPRRRLRLLPRRMNDSITGACATSAAPSAQRVEIRTPVGRDRGGIGEVLLVLVLDERRVAAEQRAGGLELLHRCSSTATSLRWMTVARCERHEACAGPQIDAEAPASSRRHPRLARGLTFSL